MGLDIQENLLKQATERAAKLGLAERCVFTTKWSEPVDAVISTDAFEHFEDPGAILRLMASLLRDDGTLYVEFGCTWYHPYGGHLFLVFPWAHLLFTERTLLRWRADFRSDGARRFGEVVGGLNQMTIGHWERLVRESGLRLETLEYVPIRGAERLHCRLTRELLTSTLRARLRRQ